MTMPIDSGCWRGLTYHADSALLQNRPEEASMKRLKSFLAALTLAASSLTAAHLLAAEPPKPAVPLSAEAKIDRATAEKTALARVPSGRIKEGELEREHGRLIWSFDIAQPTSPNIAEVQVDAISGKVVSVATETPADQAKEAAADRAKAHQTPPK
jgi:hypothetical protein